jgi:hypothetical protein
MAATAEFDGGSCLDLGPSRKEPCPIASGLDKKKYVYSNLDCEQRPRSKFGTFALIVL